MLEKPALEDRRIVACLKNEFGLSVEKVSFLPIGADRNTAVYRAVADKDVHFFVKLRRGNFDKAVAAVPKYLSSHGIKQVIPSLSTRMGQLWANLDPFKVMLYPYVEGHNGFEAKLSKQQWAEFGVALKSFHAADVPPEMTNGIKHERFSSRWRKVVKSHLARIDDEVFDEPVAVEMAIFLNAKRDETLELVKRAEQLAQELQNRPPGFILCHGDIHAWNLLIDTSGALYMVDWDTLIIAPKERDLMFIGGGLGNSGYTPREEQAFFYQGYGQTQVNPIALAYYRYERIIEDIAVYCEQIFLSNKSGKDRRQALEDLKSNYLPNSAIAVARHTDRKLRAD
jgi:spectinomycin phosphotransferase